MPRVKITNLKPGACVINSLKITLAGMASVIRDAGVVGDADLSELEHAGIISVQPFEVAAPVVQPTEKPAVPEAKIQKVSQPAAEVAVDKPKKNKKKTLKSEKTIAATTVPAKKPGTDFRAVDGPEDVMGSKVVVMGEMGPEVRKMNPGINGGTGPKYVGDESFEPDDEDGFTVV